MSNSKLIHDYLDGELDSSMQDSLFHQLASDSEMRAEFSQQMKLHVITQNDMSTISPPMDSTNAIFATLGFTIPSVQFAGGAGASVAAGAGAGFLAALWSGAKKMAPYALTTIVATVITALILFWLFDKYFSNNDEFSNSGSIPSSVPFVSSYQKPADAPVKQIVQNSGLSKKEIERIYTKAFNDAFNNYMKAGSMALALNNRQSQTNNAADAEDYDNTFKKVTFERKRDFSMLNPIMNPSPANEKENKYVGNMINNVPYYPFYVESGDNLERTKFGLELRNINAKSAVASGTVPTSSNPWFSNMSLALSYNFDKNHSLGFAIGQEAFMQDFTNLTDGIVYSFKQNPLLFWYGLQYKLTLPDLIYANVIYPYASVLVGGTTVGPMGRIQAGLTFKPDKRVSFYLGAEASTLYYNVQNNIYNTTKYGVTYGIGLHY